MVETAIPQQILPLDHVQSVASDRERPELRQYQREANADLREAVRAGHKRILLQAATGAGKTIQGCSLIDGAERKRRHSLFIAHRRELIHQCSAKISEYGIRHSVVMAGSDKHITSYTTLASIQTIWRRKDKIYLPKFELIIVDEAHHVPADTYQQFLDSYENAIVIGLTATPCRTDGKGLGDYFTAMVQNPPISKLIKLGFLVPAVYYAPTEPDLNKLRVQRGDYVLEELEEEMDKPKYVGDVVYHWSQIAKGKRTIVFASGVKHSMHLCDEFRKIGIVAEHIDHTTDSWKRDQILSAFKDGDVQVICNFGILTEGFDCPAVECISLARPTKNLGLYVQMCGRGLRPWPGKEDCTILDHSGGVFEHGFLEEIETWHLDPTRRNENKTQAERKKHEAKQIVCERCATVYVGKRACPNCGHEYEIKGDKVAYIDGRLGVVSKTDKKSAPVKMRYSIDDRKRWFAMLLHEARERGYKTGWAAWAFKSKFKEWPPSDWKPQPMEPNAEVSGFIHHLRIRYARGKGRGSRNAN